MITLPNLTVDQQWLVPISFKTKSGADATVDGVPVWEVVSGDVTLTTDETGLSCIIFPNSAGVVEVKVSADADLGEGVVLIETIFGGAVGIAQAASIESTPVVQDKPVV